MPRLALPLPRRPQRGKFMGMRERERERRAAAGSRSQLREGGAALPPNSATARDTMPH